MNRNLTYDAKNHLTGVSGGTAATFVYDGDGQRVKATVGGVTTIYPSASLRSGSGQALATTWNGAAAPAR